MPPEVEDARRAIAARDWERVRALLHPYLRWTCADGTVVRGRRQVLAMLAGGEAPGPPSAWELRDGQVYRWTA